MSKVSKSSAKSTTPKISPKELQKKYDELTKTVETLKIENETLKTKFKLLCKKIVDNTDLSTYQFLDPNIEPDLIDIKDLLHMIQTLGLLAAKLNKADGIENHVENLELRITELLTEQGSMFKNKIKLQERLEFIMQERDVWKRNAETLKKMYEKLAKEFEDFKRPASGSSIIVGAYKANIDANNQNQRVFSANIPRSHYESVHQSKIDKIQLNTVDLQLIKQLSQIKPTLNSSTTTKNTIQDLNDDKKTNEKELKRQDSFSNKIKPSTNNNNNNISINNNKEELLFDKVNKDKQNLINNKILTNIKNPTSDFKSSSSENLYSYPSLESFEISSPLTQPKKANLQQQQQQQQQQSIFNINTNTTTTTTNNNSNNNIFKPNFDDNIGYKTNTTNCFDFLKNNNNTNSTITITTEYNTLDRPMTSASRKNVSFNNAIDIRTYPKSLPKYTTTNKTLNEFLYTDDRQLEINFNDENENINSDKKINNQINDQNQQQPYQPSKSILITKPVNDFNKNIDVNNNFENNVVTSSTDSFSKNLLKNNINDELANLINSFNMSNLKIENRNNSNNSVNSFNSEINNNNNNNNNNSKFIIDRRSISSKKKLPGETPVKDLEKTLKMVIIKELSIEKIDENDWKMFAKRVGITENEIKDWISLRLQFPMARVLSVWSAKPDATVRLLHRHLSAPCFNYALLAKRIETFYDVL